MSTLQASGHVLAPSWLPLQLRERLPSARFVSKNCRQCHGPAVHLRLTLTRFGAINVVGGGIEVQAERCAR